MIKLTSIGLLITVSAVSMANLVNNGSFDGQTGAYKVEDQGLTGWTLLGQSTDELFVFGVNPDFGPQSDHLDLSGFTDASGMGIEQTVATLTATNYVLKFDYWTGSDFYPGSIDVWVDGQLIVDELTSGLDVFARTYTYQFTATRPTKIGFTVGDQAWVNDLDNISVEAVPEPASMTVLAVALVALAKKRKTR